MKQNKKLILIQLNEINFNFLNLYNSAKLKNLNQISTSMIKSVSENEYEKLEPWIQWVSVYTGKTAKEHGVFRLGDIVNNKMDQIFEIVESKGYSVGAIMPMNASNRLQKAKYFLPDPWTKTHSDNSVWSKIMTAVFSQTVNDNSTKKIGFINYLKLLIIFLKFFRFKNFSKYFHYVVTSKKYYFRKAFFLDLLIHDIHYNLLKKKKTDFSSVFFNAGAHIQHHYFFNSKFYKLKNQNPEWYMKKEIDPVYESYLLYENILEDYLKLNCDIIISTGLSQIPATETKFYYRLKKHKFFFNMFDIKYKDIYPRMTRDFLIEFENKKDLKNCINFFEKINSSDEKEKIFNYDIREHSLFVTLSYSKELKKNYFLEYNKKRVDLFSQVVFVALKNGIHHHEGFNFFSKNLINDKNLNNFHIKDLFFVIKNYFNK